MDWSNNLLIGDGSDQETKKTNKDVATRVYTAVYSPKGVLISVESEVCL